jgi:hypothetical protein
MKYFSFTLIVCVLLFSCSSTETYKKAENAQDAGREFIRASLNGDYKKAKYYLLTDSTNIMILDKWKKDTYDKLTNEERVSYTQANILPIEIQQVNDSLYNYTFTNTYKNKDTTTIQIVRVNGEWLVNLQDIH